MGNIKSQTKSILIMLAYSLLLHCLVQARLWLNDGEYRPGYTDIDLYSIWAKCFSEQLFGGDLLPRWLQCVNDGMGQPTMFIYQPLVYYISSAFYIPMVTAANPFFQIQMTALLGTFLSSTTFFFWMRRHTDGHSALISSLIYSSFHFNFNICVVVNQSVAMQWSFVWMPLILMATENLLEKRRFQIPFLATSYFFLIVTHAISALIFSFGLGVYILFLLKQSNWDRAVLAKFILSILLGSTLAALVILPSLEIMPFTNMHLFTAGLWNYQTQFMFTPNPVGLSQDIPSNFWVIAGPLLSWLFYRDILKTENLSEKTKTATYTMALVCTLASFMMISISKPIWSLLPILQMVQSPWRFFILQVISLSFVAGIYCNVTNRKSEIILVMFFAVACIYTLLPANMFVASSESHLSPEQAHEISSLKKLWMEHHYEINWELSPNSMCKHAKNPIDLNRCAIEAFTRVISRPDLASESDSSIFRTTLNKPREIKISYDAKSETLLTIKRAYFHGNVAYTDKSEEILLSNNEDGLITLTVPKGRGIITVSLPYFMSEKIGAGISLASLTILLMMVAFEIRNKSRKENHAWAVCFNYSYA